MTISALSSPLLPGQQGAEPALRRDVADCCRQIRSDVVVSGDIQYLSRGHPAGSLALQEVQAAPQLVGVGRYPLPPDPDQRALGGGQRPKLILGEHLVADRDLPLKCHQRLPAEPAAGSVHHSFNGAAGGQPKSQSMTPAPPGGQQQADTRGVELRRRLGEKVMRAKGIQLPLRRPRLVQRTAHFRVDATGPAELGQQQLLGVLEPAIEAGSTAPDLFGRYQQARVLQRLQQELQTPCRVVGVRLLGAAVGFRRLLVRSRGEQPDGEPGVAHRRTDLVPGRQDPGQLVQVGIGSIDLGVDAVSAASQASTVVGLARPRRGGRRSSASAPPIRRVAGGRWHR